MNFHNPHRPRRTPAVDAIKYALPLDERPTFRYVQLPYLIALKLYAGGRRALADILELLKHNPDADLAEIRSTAAPFDPSGELEKLIAEAAAGGR